MHIFWAIVGGLLLSGGFVYFNAVRPMLAKQRELRRRLQLVVDAVGGTVGPGRWSGERSVEARIDEQPVRLLIGDNPPTLHLEVSQPREVPAQGYRLFLKLPDHPRLRMDDESSWVLVRPDGLEVSEVEDTASRARAHLSGVVPPDLHARMSFFGEQVSFRVSRQAIEAEYFELPTTEAEVPALQEKLRKAVSLARAIGSGA